MILKMLHRESKTITGAAIIVGVLSFASRIVGLVRDRILAGEFGAGDVLDIYYAAFKIPDFLFSLLVIGALSASFIPLFTKHYKAIGKNVSAWKLTNNVLNLIAVTFAIISILLFIFADPLSQLIAPGFHPTKQETVAAFTRVMLLAQFILSISVVYGSVLQGMRRFFLYSLAPIFYNIGIIFGAFFFVDRMGIIGLAWGVVLGAILHFLVQLYGVLQAGYTYEWRFLWRDKESVEIIKLMGPRVLSIGVSQINFIIMTIIASGLAVGSVTVFNFAYNIQFFPIGIIGIAYAIAAFPALCDHANKKHFNKFIETLSATTRQILFLIVPMMFIFMILRAQIVRVVVGAGAFDWAATILTADTLAFFSLSFFAQALVFLYARAYFALHDTITPFVAGVISGVVNIFASLALVHIFGVVGLGAAFSISSLVNLVLLWAPLRNRLGSIGELKILQSLYIISTASIAAAIMTQVLKPIMVHFISLETFFGVLFQGLVAGGAGLVVYGVVAYFLKSPEMFDFIAAVRRKFFKKQIPEEALSTESPTLT